MSYCIPTLVTLLLASGSYDFAPYYLQDPAVEQAYRAFKAGSFKEADKTLKGFLAAGTARDDDSLVDAATFLRSEVLRMRRKAAGKRRGAPFRAERMALLREIRRTEQWGSLANLELAVFHENHGRVRQALEHYAAVDPGAAGYVNGAIRSARLLLKRRRAIGGLKLLKAAESAGPTRSETREITLLRAQLLAAAGKKGKAAAILVGIWSDGPSRKHGKAAARLLRKLRRAPRAGDKLILEFDETSRGSTAKLTNDLKRFRKKWRRPSKWAVLFVKGVIAEVGQKRPKRALKLYASAARAKRGFVKGHALFRLAQLQATLGDARAGGTFERLAEKLPDHPLAPDALLKAAGLASKAGHDAKESALMGRLASRYREHPKRADHLWISAWDAWRNGRHRRALRRWQTIESEHGPQKHLGQATWGERASYWQARAMFELGQKAKALERYERLVTSQPLSYYSHQAFNRLCEYNPERCEVLRKRVAVDPFDLSSPMDLSALSVARTRALDGAVGLVRLGLFDRARSELLARKRAGQLSSDGQTLLVGVGLRRRNPKESTRIVQWRGGLPGYPNGQTTRLWKLAYPLAFWSSVEKWSGEAKINPWLVLALIRHESRYNPKVVSHAKAVGLMQMLLSTAKGVARAMRVEGRISRSTLKMPDRNIQLGSRFLRELMRLFGGNEALALAAYNAGPGRAKQWWKRFREERRTHTDEFIEEIPYRETHSYVKSVLASYGVYRYLYGRAADSAMRSIPLDPKLPTALGGYFGRAAPKTNP